MFTVLLIKQTYFNMVYTLEVSHQFNKQQTVWSVVYS